METFYLLKIGEIALKGGNRDFFEKMLRRNIKRSLGKISSSVTDRTGRTYLTIDSAYEQRTEEALRRMFGLTYFTKALIAKKEYDDIKAKAVETARRVLSASSFSTFKVDTRRTDKSFPMSSYEVSAETGAAILEAFPRLRVDVHNPDFTINIEIRERAYVYGPEAKGPGGLPVGIAGKGLLLLSGGIDSPVAGYMMAKRGVRIGAVYFHAYPYTSDEAREKVISLARILSTYVGRMRLFIVPFTDVQLRIRERAAVEETTLLMRACMMKISSMIAVEREAISLVTGESLSQVASQTAESIRFTGSMTDFPVFRPLIGMDKEEIIAIAKRIGTYETSILPYEDCCTIFSPAHPLVKPDFGRMKLSMAALAVDDLLTEAVGNTELLVIDPNGDVEAV